ncbi:hypothetical protein ABTI71_18915, partial [Acinetobacter baumannii]
QQGGGSVHDGDACRFADIITPTPARVPGLRKRVSAVVPSRGMTILRLALPSPLRQAFDYRLPAALAADGVPAAGVRVRVPFGRQQLVALVLEETA